MFGTHIQFCCEIGGIYTTLKIEKKNNKMSLRQTFVKTWCACEMLCKGDFSYLKYFAHNHENSYSRKIELIMGFFVPLDFMSTLRFFQPKQKETTTTTTTLFLMWWVWILVRVEGECLKRNRRPHVLRLRFQLITHSKDSEPNLIISDST